MITQVEIARRLGLDVSSVNKILNRRPGPVFRKETVKKVFRTARDLGYDFNKIKFAHRRRHSRRAVSLNAELAVYKIDGSLFDAGMATIRDISLGGAKVTDVTLPHGSFPAEPFSITLRPLTKPLDEVEIRGRVVRLHINGGVTYGVKFESLEASIAQRVRRIAGN